jgi:hypothetical protein
MREFIQKSLSRAHLQGVCQVAQGFVQRRDLPVHPCEVRRLPLDCHCSSGVNRQYRRGINLGGCSSSWCRGMPLAPQARCRPSHRRSRFFLCRFCLFAASTRGSPPHLQTTLPVRCILYMYGCTHSTGKAGHISTRHIGALTVTRHPTHRKIRHTRRSLCVTGRGWCVPGSCIDRRTDAAPRVGRAHSESWRRRRAAGRASAGCSRGRRSSAAGTR